MKAQMQKLNQEAEEDKSPDISALEEDRDRVSTFFSIGHSVLLFIGNFSQFLVFSAYFTTITNFW